MPAEVEHSEDEEIQGLDEMLSELEADINHVGNIKVISAKTLELAQEEASGTAYAVVLGITGLDIESYNVTELMVLDIHNMSSKLVGYKAPAGLDAILCLFVGKDKDFRKVLDNIAYLAKHPPRGTRYQGAVCYATKKGENQSFIRRNDELLPVLQIEMYKIQQMMLASLGYVADRHSTEVALPASILIFFEWMEEIKAAIESSADIEDWYDVVNTLPKEILGDKALVSPEELAEIFSEFHRNDKHFINMVQKKMIENDFYVLDEKLMVEDTPMDKKLFDWLPVNLLLAYYAESLTQQSGPDPSYMFKPIEEYAGSEISEKVQEVFARIAKEMLEAG